MPQKLHRNHEIPERRSLTLKPGDILEATAPCRYRVFFPAGDGKRAVLISVDDDAETGNNAQTGNPVPRAKSPEPAAYGL